MIPSIPGYGFSGPTRERGWDVARVARAWAELMRRLGYERYGAQGGDFGAGISLALGAVAPERVAGVHVNYLPTPPAPEVRPLAERSYDIRHWSEFERGGHFAALEVPELLAGDVQDFFTHIR
ncbi:alpha/beta fold hydrolase [Microbispora sp. NBC_01389]|uniref:alpha/beta fold hydrolase n=1 Tax=Microbispora sp. NBC_01389 TaxID=2903584 RepID=UPI00386CD651